MIEIYQMKQEEHNVNILSIYNTVYDMFVEYNGYIFFYGINDILEKNINNKNVKYRKAYSESSVSYLNNSEILFTINDISELETIKIKFPELFI